MTNYILTLLLIANAAALLADWHIDYTARDMDATLKQIQMEESHQTK